MAVEGASLFFLKVLSLNAFSVGGSCLAKRSVLPKSKALLDLQSLVLVSDLPPGNVIPLRLEKSQILKFYFNILQSLL